MSKTYKVICQIPEDRLHALIGYYEAPGITGFSVNLVQPAAPAAQEKAQPVASPPPAQTLPPPNQRRSGSTPKQPGLFFVGGRRNKGISGLELVLQILNTSPEPVVSTHAMRTEFVKHGFAKTSISSPLSILAKERKIIRVDDARYALRSRYIAPSVGESQNS